MRQLGSLLQQFEYPGTRRTPIYSCTLTDAHKNCSTWTTKCAAAQILQMNSNVNQWSNQQWLRTSSVCVQGSHTHVQHFRTRLHF